MIRALTWIVGLAAFLWGAWWFGGSYALDRAARDWFAQNPEAGHDGLSVSGFPNRFDLRLEKPRYAGQGVAWRGDWLSIYALSYKPWHVIAALPPQQEMTLGDQALQLESRGLMASVVVAPSPDVPLERVTTVGEALRLVDPAAGWTMALASLNFAVDRVEGSPKDYRIGLRLTDFTPDPGLMQALQGPDSALPGVIGLLYLDATVGLDREINRFAGQGPIRPTHLALDALDLEWGELRFGAKGKLTVVDGLAEGQIDLQLRNWRLVPEVLKSAGVVTAATADNISRGLEAYAANSPDPDLIEMPLTLEGGQMRLGAFPLGPVPRL